MTETIAGEPANENPAPGDDPATAFIQLLDKAIEESTLEDFRRYIRDNQQYGDFCIASDYCLGDAGKHNDVMTFTVMPAISGLPAYQAEIERLMPRDLKKVGSVSDGTLALLRSRKFFHFNFVIRNSAGLTHNRSLSPQQAAVHSLTLAIRTIEGWNANQPEGKEKFQGHKKKVRSWIRELNKGSPNLKLFRNIVLNGTLAAYVAHLISIESRSKKITWFGDRDKMQSYEKVVEDIFDLTHFALCERMGLANGLPALATARPDASKEDPNKLWYDSLIRVPDYLAGTLASWEWGTDNFSHKKHSRILHHVIAENPNCAIVRLSLAPEKFMVGSTKVRLVP